MPVNQILTCFHIDCFSACSQAKLRSRFNVAREPPVCGCFFSRLPVSLLISIRASDASGKRSAHLHEHRNAICASPVTPAARCGPVTSSAHRPEAQTSELLRHLAQRDGCFKPALLADSKPSTPHIVTLIAQLWDIAGSGTVDSRCKPCQCSSAAGVLGLSVCGMTPLARNQCIT